MASFPTCLPVLISPLPSEPNPCSEILNQQYPFITTTLSLSLFGQLERYNLTTLLICVILSVVHLLVIPSQSHSNDPTHLPHRLARAHYYPRHPCHPHCHGYHTFQFSVSHRACL
jgi:hypothetical protein